MGTLELTVKVLNISPKATVEDLVSFFSYCGTIDKLELQRDGDLSQRAVVTFRQHYALQTALLLNDAVILDRRVCIMPLDNTSVPISRTSVNMNSERDGSGIVLKEQVLNAGRMLAQKADSAISAAGQAVGSIRSAIAGQKGALWLSGILGRVSKSTAELGNAKTRNNSRKQK